VAKYLIDANSLIEPFRRFYAMDLAPGFWLWLEDQFAQSVLFTPQQVFEEVKDGDDLAKWLKKQADEYSFVLAPDSTVTKANSTILKFVSENYAQEHADEFLRGGDPWLIAHGMANPEFKVVTFESIRNPQRHGKTNLYQGKVLLPFVAQTFGVDCITLFELMRITGAKLNR